MLHRFSRLALPRALPLASTVAKPTRLPAFSKRFASHSSVPTVTGPIQVTAPDLSAIRANEYFEPDTQLVKEEEAKLNLTEAAVKQLVTITTRQPNSPNLALRVGVESGGCHGYQYTMELTNERNVDDYIFQPPVDHCVPVVVDLTSLKLLKGSTLHHATELIGSSFRLENNPQAKDDGGCGCGVSWEAKPDAEV